MLSPWTTGVALVVGVGVVRVVVEVLLEVMNEQDQWRQLCEERLSWTFFKGLPEGKKGQDHKPKNKQMNKVN